MKKGKILIAIIALGATSAVFANGAIPVAQPNYFDGAYVGIGAGVQHMVGDINNQVDDTLTTESRYLNADNTANTQERLYSLPIKADVGNTALNGEIFLGYGKTFNTCWYGGAEIYARYAHSQIDVSAGQNDYSYYTDYTITDRQETSLKINSDFAYGGTLKLGYLFTPKTMFYILAGIEYNKFDVDVHHVFSDASDYPISYYAYSNSYPYSYSFDDGRWAFVPGVGMETMVTDKLSLRAQYTYADYGSFSNHRPSSGISNVGSSSEYYPESVTSVANDDISLHRGLFTLGLSYRFNGV